MSQLDELRSVAERLERMLRTIEPAFLEAGGHLAASVEQLGTLTGSFGTMAARLEADDTAAAMAALRDVSARIGALGDTTRSSDERLQALQSLAAGMGARLAALRKTIGEVRVLAVNAKVEAAHVTALNVDFGVFTREIGRLASLAGESLGTLSDELAGLLASIGGARQDLAVFARDHRQSLASVGARLGNGLAAMAQRSASSAQAIRALADLSRRTAEEVAEVVVGLQVGDMTRQRGEHVVEALRTLLELMAAADMPADHRAMLAASVCRLQAAQADGAADDLRRETTRIRGNLEALSRDIADLPARCAALYAGTAGSQSSFLSELSQELQEAHVLLHTYAEARAGVDTVVAGISTVVAGMVRHIEAIRDIEADMRVMGLNATFKCARLGYQGRALSVIAQELRQYSNRTAEDGTAIMESLRGLIAAAERMDAEEHQGGSAADAMGAAMADAVRMMEGVGAELSRGLSSLSGGCGRATAALGRARSLLDSHPEFVATLGDAAAALGQAAGPDAPDPGMLESIRDEVLHVLGARYTMAAERKVHDLLGGAAPAEAATPAVADADDFLF